MFIQQVLNGLTMGSIYSLLAVGVTMIYKSLGMLNFAHGDMMMVSAFICLSVIKFGVPLYLAILLAIVVAVTLGYILERFYYRKLEFSSFINMLIASVGVSFVMRNSSIVIWGTNPHLFPQIFSTIPIDLGGFLLIPQSIGVIAVAAVLATLLQLFFYKTKAGKSMRVAASDPEAASILGINVTKCRMLTFVISAGLAAIAGILLAPMSYARVDMSILAGLKAFAAAILGGIGNVVGALVGGVLLGLVEALGANYISTAYKDVLAFLVLFIVLFVKPTGLFAKRIEQKL
jgi:branched-chain amino acid transport system permease protein